MALPPLPKIGQGYSSKIGTRISPVDNKTTEYYDAANNQGFAKPDILADFVNKNFAGTNANAQNVFGLLGGNYQAPAAPQVQGAATPTPAMPVAPTPAIPNATATPTVPIVNPNVQKYENEVKANLLLSPEEQAAQQEEANLTASYKMGLNKTEDQAIAMPFITGQQASLERSYNTQAQTLQQKMAIAQAKRLSALESSKFALEREDKLASETKSENLRLADEEKQAAKEQTAIQQKGFDNALDLSGAGVKTPAVNVNGTFYRVSDKHGFGTMQEFLDTYGVSSEAEARQKGILSDYDPSKNDNTELLSVSEANALNVPYGTTRGQAVKMGITPLSASEAKGSGKGGTGNGSVFTPAQNRTKEQAKLADDDSLQYFLNTPKEFRDLWLQNTAPLGSDQSFTIEQLVENYTSWYNNVYKKKTNSSSSSDDGDLFP